MLPEDLVRVLEQSKIEQYGDEYWLLAPQMDRKTYETFKKIVNGLRGEWVKKKDAHVFLYDPSEDIADIVGSGQMPEFNPHHFFPTPLEVIDDMMVYARPDRYSTPRILEPSAGDGRIARKIREKVPGAIIDCVEIDDRNRKILTEQGFNVVGRDFLAEDFEPVYDFVLMNPPFQGQAYQKHIRKAHGLLVKAGTLVTVAPRMAVQDKKFRNWAFKHESCWCDIGSPFETTNVRCVIIEIGQHLPELYSDPPYGYGSWAMHNVCIAVDSDARFWAAVDRSIPTIRALQYEIESAVDRIIKDSESTLCLDEETLKLVVAHYAEEIGLIASAPAEEPVKVAPSVPVVKKSKKAIVDQPVLQLGLF